MKHGTVFLARLEYIPIFLHYKKVIGVFEIRRAQAPKWGVDLTRNTTFNRYGIRCNF